MLRPTCNMAGVGFKLLYRLPQTILGNGASRTGRIASTNTVVSLQTLAI